MTIKNVHAHMRNFDSRNGFNFPLPGVLGRIWHVDTINGSDTGNDGKYAGSGPEQAAGHAFATMAKVFTMIDDYDIIVLSGVVKEQVTAPLGVLDVSIIGSANSPRQATSGGVPTGGGACWLPPASPTAATALLRLIEAGWSVQNILMAAHTSSPAIKLQRAEDGVTPDASHALIKGVRFAAGTTNIGVEDVGGCYNVAIEDCIFQTTTGIKGTSTGIDVPTINRFLRNIFDRCTTGISGSYQHSQVRFNVFRQTPNDGTVPKINMKAVASQGSFNFVTDNYFPDAAANVTIAKGYTPATSDIWRNFVSDTAAYIVTVPA